MQPTEASSRKSPRQTASSSRASNSMDVYLNDAGRHARLSAREERSQLRRLVDLRRARWKALLSYPSLAPAIVNWLEASEPMVELPLPAELKEKFAAQLAELDARRNHSAARDLGEAVAELAAAIVERDTDCEAADALETQIVREHDEEGDPLFGLVDPHRDRKPFIAYRRRVQQTGARLRIARNRFVCANLRLVVVIAKRYSNHRMSLADRVQEGNLGLLKAVERFDPERGTRFSTYAAWWIRHTITRALVNRGRKIRIPAHLHTIFIKSRTAERTLRAELGREPTLQELAVALDLPPHKVADAREAMELRSVGLDAPTAGVDSRPVAEVLEAPEFYDPDTAIDDRRNLHIASSALDDLNPMERDIIEHRFGLHGNEPLTLRTLGERYSLSRERIRQLQNRALRKLRGVIESSSIPAIAFAS
jgi:RNA polymerase primary sigma factor